MGVMPEIPIPYMDLNVYLYFSLEEIVNVKESKVKQNSSKLLEHISENLSNELLIDELLLMSLDNLDQLLNKGIKLHTLSPFYKDNLHSLEAMNKLNALRLDSIEEIGKLSNIELVIPFSLLWMSDFVRLFGKFAWEFDKSGFLSSLEEVSSNFCQDSLNNFIGFFFDFLKEVFLPNKVLIFSGNSLVEFSSLDEFRSWFSLELSKNFNFVSSNAFVLSLGGYPFDSLASYYLIGVSKLKSLIPEHIIGVLASWNNISEEYELLSNWKSRSIESMEKWNWIRLVSYFLSLNKEESEGLRLFSSVPQKIISKILNCKSFYSSKSFLDSIRRGTGFKMKAVVFKDLFL